MAVSGLPRPDGYIVWIARQLRLGVHCSIASHLWDTDELYEKKLTNQQLHAAISQLPEKQAKRIYAYYFLDMDEPTIARTEGVSHQAVHSSIQHGLKRIEKILKKSF